MFKSLAIKNLIQKNKEKDLGIVPQYVQYPSVQYALQKKHNFILPEKVIHFPFLILLNPNRENNVSVSLEAL